MEITEVKALLDHSLLAGLTQKAVELPGSPVQMVAEDFSPSCSTGLTPQITLKGRMNKQIAPITQ